MPLGPVRINRCIFRIRKLSVVTTVQDADYREAKDNRVYAAPIDVIGQLVGMEDALTLGRTMTGDQLPTNVHSVFRTLDLRRQGITISKGDRLIEVMLNAIGGVGVNLFNISGSQFQCVKAVPGSPFGGNRQKSFARPILLHVTWEILRKVTNSV